MTLIYTKYLEKLNKESDRNLRNIGLGIKTLFVLGVLHFGLKGYRIYETHRNKQSLDNIMHEITSDGIIDSKEEARVYHIVDWAIGEYNATKIPNKKLLPTDTNQDGFIDSKEKDNLYKIIGAEFKKYNLKK